MRQVAVTEGDKVEAQIRFGVEVNGYGVGELVKRVEEATDAEIDRLVAEYDEQYAMAAELRPGGPRRESLRYAARTELGLRAFLDSGPFHAFTDTFEDLAGLEQLPGMAVQRLMADGYGFGAEGDWKTAALVRAMKVMAAGLQRRHVVHGGLHLSSRSPGAEGAGGPHAGNLPLAGGGSALVRNPSAGHRRQGRSGAAGLHRAGRARPSTWR